jgi:preprotein translocase subunit Sec61beta
VSAEPRKKSLTLGRSAKIAVSPRALVLGSALVSIALLAIFLAAGGASYEPEQVRDPCQPRPWRSPDSLQEIAEQFSLSALDGAACELRVSREVLARGLATEESREEFARRHRISDRRLESAVRAGLVRAVDDAERAGAMPGLAAGPLRAIAERIPVDDAIAVIQDPRGFLGQAGGLLGSLGELLPP